MRDLIVAQVTYFDPFEDVTLRQSEPVLKLIELLRRYGGASGHTHVQKALYLVQAVVETPCGFDYRLYSHGPFSQDLERRLRVLQDRGHLIRERGHGRSRGNYRCVSRPRGDDVYNAQLAFVARKVGRWPASKLETVATTQMLRLSYPEFDDAEIRSRLTSIKEHVTKDEARQAAAELDGLLDEARALGLIPDARRDSAEPRLARRHAMELRLLELRRELAAEISPKRMGEISVEIEEVEGGRPPTFGWMEAPVTLS